MRRLSLLFLFPLLQAFPAGAAEDMAGRPPKVLLVEWESLRPGSTASPALRAEAEKLEKAGAAVHTAQKAIWTTYQDELSFRPPGPNDIGKARFMEVVVTRVKPGRIPDYVEFLKAASGAPTG
jgi:hypothetical protein